MIALAYMYMYIIQKAACIQVEAALVTRHGHKKSVTLKNFAHLLCTCLCTYNPPSLVSAYTTDVCLSSSLYLHPLTHIGSAHSFP